jgi:hypothetical protein
MDPRLKVVNHVVALLQEAFEVVEQIRNAPESPFTSYLPAKLRRVFRRNANRLRLGKLRPKFPNIRSADDLATLLQRTADRDETIERGFQRLKRIDEEIERVRVYQAAELEEGTRIVYQLAWQRAQEDGPESKAADFFRVFQEMIVKGTELRTLKRRDKEAALPEKPFHPPGADPALELREAIIAAELLAAPPAGEPVLRFPSSAIDAAEPPLLFRIGIEEKAWVGRFEQGTTDYTTVQLMPDGAHLLVVASGAGYIVEAVTRSLAAEAGTDIMEVLLDQEAGLLILDRGDTYFEAFGPNGPLWKTGRVGAGAIRNLEFGEHAVSGETQQGSSPDWVEFSIDVATGEVSWGVSPPEL